MATNPLVAHYISSYIADVFPDIVAPSAPTPSPFDEEEADRRFGKFPISRPQTATTAGTTSQETGDKDFSPTTTGTGASVGTYSYAGTPGSLDPFSPLAQQISAYSSASIFNPSSYPELIAKNIFGLTPTYDPITGLVSVTPPNVGLLGAPGIGAVANLVSGYMQGKFQEAAKLAAAGVPGSGLATLNGQTVAMINGKLYGNIPTGMSYQDAVSAVEDYFDKASLVQTYQEEGFVGDVDTGYHPDVVLDNVQDKLAYAYSEYGRVPEGGYAGSGFSTSSPDPSSGVSEYSEAGRPPATGSSSASSSSSTTGSSPASEGPPGGNGNGNTGNNGGPTSGVGGGIGGQMGGPRAFGGSVGYAMGGMSGGNSFSGFVEGPPQNYSNGATVADTVNTQVREGSFIINAPATEELQSLGMLPQNKVAKLAKGGKMVDVALSKGEYIVDKDDVDNYGGYSFLEAVNDKGRSEVGRRQKAAEGGTAYTGPSPMPRGFDAIDKDIDRLKSWAKEAEDPSIKNMWENIASQREGFRISPILPKSVQENISTYGIPKIQGQFTGFGGPEYEEYRKGVEFGDIETGFNLLNQTAKEGNYNELLMAGLRDTRTLSDFVITVPRFTYNQAIGYHASGQYDPKTNRALIRNPSLALGPEADNSFTALLDSNKEVFLDPFSSYDTILAHELMHKGAEALESDPNFNPSESYNALYKKYSEINKKERTGNTAEHRYITAVLNEAGLIRMQKQVESLKRTAPEKTEALQTTLSEDILTEMERAYAYYMTPDQQEKFANKNLAVVVEHGTSTFNESGFIDESGYIEFDTDSFRGEEGFKRASEMMVTMNEMLSEEYGTKLFEKAIVKKPIEVQRKPDRVAPKLPKAAPKSEKKLLDYIRNVFEGLFE